MSDKSIEERLGLGGTGQFPLGKLNEADEGELTIAVGVEAGRVVVLFGKVVEWIGFDTHQARNFCKSVLMKCEEIDGGGE